MPRKTLVIGDFKGGLNNVKSEKDIDTSESPQIFNANNEDEGRLKLTGSAKDNYLGFNDSMTVSTAGSGFFSFSHDYTMVCSITYTGTDSASSSHATRMTDGTAAFPVDGLIGMRILNVTNGSTGIITDNAETWASGKGWD